ncbi:P-loop containing nucleoside triphosphate hydrolase protein [Ephemerocybe angulata]|uniref:DNA 3'-5' helicase n=1 Tax=Ephemerocybe angulata TaxID=980116 RepID=A0A8H6H5R8_9AGAR|nr:P-loop containing nucleoside triphosphate hydrolase protein [Tulosesus angulatus]
MPSLESDKKTALETAREQDEEHDSAEWRARLRASFLSKFGKEPYEWQMDVTEALVLGLDCLCIAGTGAGKTMPFMMPLLLDESKRVLVISPLKILQAEQARRFEKMGIVSTAVNEDTWTGQLKRDLEHGSYRALFTSPEMCLHNEAFRTFLTTPDFASTLAMIDYALLAKLRSLVPTTIPILATSATLPPTVLHDIRVQLRIHPESVHIVNLGNDRFNITASTRIISSSHDFSHIMSLITKHGLPPTCLEDFIKTCLFVNEVFTAIKLCHFIRKHVPKGLHGHIDFMFALRSPSAKQRVMEEFEEGKVRILVATEAAGMGADIPDIVQVIQLGVPTSLSVWVQRAGRAGRLPSIQAQAILLVEKSVFKRKKAGAKSKDVGEDGKEWVRPFIIVNDFYYITEVCCDWREVFCIAEVHGDCRERVRSHLGCS